MVAIYGLPAIVEVLVVTVDTEVSKLLIMLGSTLRVGGLQKESSCAIPVILRYV